MSEKHTQGRLHVCSMDKAYIRDEKGFFFAESHNPLHRDSDECAANASRLVACWNACEGLTMDHFDGGWTAKGLSSHAKSLEGKLAEERKRSAAAITLLLEAASKLEIVITGIGDNYDATNLAPRIRAFLKGGAA